MDGTLMAAPHPLDAQAQAMGFPDYATWAAWDAQRRAGLLQGGPHGTPTTGQPGAPSNYLAQPQQGGQPSGWFAPGQIMGWLSNKITSATGN